MIIVIPTEIVESDINRLTNQLWKLIPMRENEENWKSQLDTVIVELAGLQELSMNQMDEKFLILLSKLEGLKLTDISFSVYRKTVFECISLLRELRL
jgi:hypothetical protein